MRDSANVLRILEMTSFVYQRFQRRLTDFGCNLIDWFQWQKVVVALVYVLLPCHCILSYRSTFPIRNMASCARICWRHAYSKCIQSELILLCYTCIFIMNIYSVLKYGKIMVPIFPKVLLLSNLSKPHLFYNAIVVLHMHIYYGLFIISICLSETLTSAFFSICT